MLINKINWKRFTHLYLKYLFIFLTILIQRKEDSDFKCLLIVVQKILRILYRTLFIYKSIEAGIKFYLIPVMIVQLIVYVDIKRFEWDNFISVYKYNTYF